MFPGEYLHDYDFLWHYMAWKVEVFLEERTAFFHKMKEKKEKKKDCEGRGRGD